jgi:sterol desaturase/sphingolipid hydroxylase (fatty acid hydroxylase superfamily)
MMPTAFWKAYFLHDLILLGRYFLFAGIAYWIFYLLKKNQWLYKKIQQRYPDRSQIKREIIDSLVSLFIFSLIFLIIHWGNKNGYTRMYKKIDAYGWAYFLCSIPLFIFWHDTWFYFTHRFMHHPKIFHHVHLKHHLSHNPTPWTSFAFHPIEAFVEAGFVFIVFLVPLHPLCVLLVITWQMAFNVYGHLGFEIMSVKFHRSALGKLFNTSTHHNMHHRLTKGNYGLYFNFWDRIMHTNHPDYENQFQINASKKLGKQVSNER